MATKKKPRVSGSRGEIHVRRTLEDSLTRKEDAAESGEAEVLVQEIEGPAAEASGNVGMTWPTDVKFKMLRIDCGGRLPCSAADLESGAGHEKLYKILWAELGAQRKRGTGGL